MSNQSDQRLEAEQIEVEGERQPKNGQGEAAPAAERTSMDEPNVRSDELAIRQREEYEEYLREAAAAGRPGIDEDFFRFVQLRRGLSKVSEEYRREKAQAADPKSMEEIKARYFERADKIHEEHREYRRRKLEQEPLKVTYD